ncbi:hypothetical protein D351_00150 [Enterococcus faecalis WKS-26-18-2]|nr:hypothetical protein D351_00150 [Enterococcus faecalis WKS-26-18-2]
MRIRNHGEKIILRGFRVMLFRMVPKPKTHKQWYLQRFRVMLFRMVPKLGLGMGDVITSFRVMLFRMVPKRSSTIRK